MSAFLVSSNPAPLAASSSIRRWTFTSIRGHIKRAADLPQIYTPTQRQAADTIIVCIAYTTWHISEFFLTISRLNAAK